MINTIIDKIMSAKEEFIPNEESMDYMSKALKIKDCSFKKLSIPVQDADGSIFSAASITLSGYPNMVNAALKEWEKLISHIRHSGNYLCVGLVIYCSASSTYGNDALYLEGKEDKIHSLITELVKKIYEKIEITVIIPCDYTCLGIFEALPFE